MLHPLRGSALHLEEDTRRKTWQGKAEVCKAQDGQLMNCYLLLLQRRIPQSPLVTA